MTGNPEWLFRSSAGERPRDLPATCDRAWWCCGAGKDLADLLADNGNAEYDSRRHKRRSSVTTALIRYWPVRAAGRRRRTMSSSLGKTRSENDAFNHLSSCGS